MLFYPNLPKVVGSDFLEARVRDIHGVEGNPFACHVFGHTHFCWDTMLDGVRLASFLLNLCIILKDGKNSKVPFILVDI